MKKGLPQTADPNHYATWQDWARAISPVLEDSTPIGVRKEPEAVLLAHKVETGNLGTARAGTAGVMLYDPVLELPVFADGTEWVSIASTAGALMESDLASPAAVKATTGTFLTADQTKLDGIETGATAEQTITLSGDATGSGTTNIAVTVLNDSHSHSNYFPMPASGGVIDVNTPLGDGIYRGPTASWLNRGPSGNNAGGLLNINTHPGNYFSQLWFDSHGDDFYHRGINNDATPSAPWDKVWTAGNDGAGSGLDADKLDGYGSADTSAVSTVVRRNSSGDIKARLFRSEYDTTNSGCQYFMTQVNTSNDNYLRPSTLAQVRTKVVGAAGGGSVGSYALLYDTSTAENTLGATSAGSSLRTANTYTNNNSAGYSAASVSGTWRCMGQTQRYNGGVYSSNKEARVTMWLRIS